jgi:diguanylate cyclase (GGDEF)-like protein
VTPEAIIRLAQLREQFIRNAGTKLDLIDQSIARLEHHPADRDLLEQIMRMMHSLGGIGSTHGFPQITVSGLAGERVCDTILAAGREARPEELGVLRENVAAMLAAIRGAPREAEPLADEQRVPSALLVGDLDPVFEEIISASGVSVENVATSADAIALAKLQKPVLMVVSWSLGDAPHLLDSIRNSAVAGHTGLIVAADSLDFLERVEALRCGADAIMERPVDPASLAWHVKDLLDRLRAVAPRILSVEDDPDEAALLQTILESAGYEVRICSEPVYFEADVHSFRPDLILMDYNLPGMSGVELARILRQQDAYATVPIVFLTLADALRQRVESLRAGADDYLVKPIQPALLLSAVAARLERARVLRSLINRDGLTGLLTHSALMERVKISHSLGERKNHRGAALVMIDVDLFKSINDGYGHVAGDKVLVCLASLLRRRLRHSDVIGRYGGEEFVLVLDDVEAAEAEALVNRLAEEFAASSVSLADGTAITATFSAGIAMSRPPRADATSWISAADSAMYRAKRAGRNRVVMAS